MSKDRKEDKQKIIIKEKEPEKKIIEVIKQK